MKGDHMNTTREYKGFRLIDGTIDNSKCPHLHMVNDDNVTRCQVCAKVFHISGAVYPAVETAYGKTVDHAFNIRIF